MADVTTTGCVARGTEPTSPGRVLAPLLAVLALAAVLLGLPITTLSAQEPVFLPGSSWGLVPPSGFAIEPSTGGMFYHPSGAVILVVTSTQPHDRSRFTAVGEIAGSGIDEGRVTSIEDVSVAGRPAYLMRLRMANRQADAISMLVQGRTSGMLMALIPDDTRSVIDEEAVLQALYTATERSLTAEDQLAGLSVAIGDLAGMRVSGMISNFGTILTDGPGDRVEDSPGQTFVTLVTFSRDRAEGYILARDAGVFSRHLQESFDGATVTASRQGVGRNGAYLELSFRRRVGDTERPGLAWSFVTGGTMVLIVVQMPVGDDAIDTTKLAAMRDSVSER